LHAYRLKLRDYAVRQYRHEQTLWALIAPHVKDAPPEPDLPAILRD